MKDMNYSKYKRKRLELFYQIWSIFINEIWVKTLKIIIISTIKMSKFYVQGNISDDSDED